MDLIELAKNKAVMKEIESLLHEAFSQNSRRLITGSSTKALDLSELKSALRDNGYVDESDFSDEKLYNEIVMGVHRRILSGDKIATKASI